MIYQVKLKNTFLYIAAACFILTITSEEIYCSDLQISIAEDYKEGKISYHQYIVYRGYLIFDPEKIFEIYPGTIIEKAEKSGTGIIMELTENWNILSDNEKNFFSSFIHGRPISENSFISPSGYFKVHYITRDKDTNKVPPDDLDNTGIPDYVEEVALAFDKARALYVDTLYFNPPYSDNGVDGPELDVYIKNTAPFYGQTFLPPNVYIEIDNNFIENIYYTKGIDGAKVTAAHELHHAIQFSYIVRSTDFFYYEVTSTFMEDQVFDEVNDYYQYLDNFFKLTQTPFNARDGHHEYGLSIWGHFLQKKHNRYIMREIWEDFKNNIPIIDAIDHTLSKYGSSFQDDLCEFYTWNYFTGTRADEENYYNEGSEYPEIQRIEYIPVTKDTIISISNKYFTPSYILLEELSPLSYGITAKTTDSTNIDYWRNRILLFEGINDPIPILFSNIDLYESYAELLNQGINSEALIVSTSVSRINSIYPMDIEVKMKDVEEFKQDNFREIYPNPFIVGEHSFMRIAFSLEKFSDVTLLIISSSGRIVKKMEMRSMSEGLHQYDVTWDGLNENNTPVPSGVYLCQLRIGDYLNTKKIAVIRR